MSIHPTILYFLVHLSNPIKSKSYWPLFCADFWPSIVIEAIELTLDDLTLDRLCNLGLADLRAQGVNLCAQRVNLFGPRVIILGARVNRLGTRVTLLGVRQRLLVGMDHHRQGEQRRQEDKSRPDLDE